MGFSSTWSLSNNELLNICPPFGRLPSGPQPEQDYYFNLCLLGVSEHSARDGVGGPRIKSHVLLVEERNWQFSSAPL